jgi:hypothetical protein
MRDDEQGEYNETDEGDVVAEQGEASEDARDANRIQR